MKKLNKLSLSVALSAAVLATPGICMEGPPLPFQFVNMGTAAEAGNGLARVNIYDQIGSNFWQDGITGKAFIEQLSAIDDSADLECHISTDGGCTKEGTVMYNALVGRKGKTNVVVDGYAMSMGSVIAMAGKNSGGTTKMVGNGFLFLHKPLGSKDRANATDMRAMADTLDAVEAQLIKPYAKASGQTDAKIAELLAANTWMNAEQALELGFIDEILGESEQIAASFDVTRIDASSYGTIPEGFLDLFVAAGDEDDSENEEEDEDSETEKDPSKKVKAEGDDSEDEDDDEEVEMTAAQVLAAERTRCKDIQNMCDNNGFSSKAAKFIANGSSLTDASDFIMELKLSVDEEIVNRNDGVISPNVNNVQSGNWDTAYKAVIR